MQDANWKTWGLVALLALGLLAEVMKHFPGSGGRMPWESDAIPRLTSPNQPYSVKLLQGRDRHTSAPPTMRVGALHGGITREQLQQFVAANTPTATTFDHEIAKAADGKKADAKKEECDEKNPKIDAKTGKPIACKKKKKDKKKEEDKKVASTEQPTPQPSTDNNKDAINSAIGEAAGSGQIPQPISNQPDNAFDTQENWERRLLNTPDLAETKRFIDHYQRNLVTTDVFYKITQEMLDDPRAEMRSLGVLCAGLTPSVVSFQLLAQVSKAERSDSPVRQQAEDFLTRYADLSNINILDRVLRSPTASYATVVAAQKLDLAARRYLTIKGSPTANPSQMSQAHAKNVTYFSRFISVLQDLERSTDATVAAQSRTTLADLQSLLGTPADTTTPGGGGKQPIPQVPAASQTAQQ